MTASWDRKFIRSSGNSKKKREPCNVFGNHCLLLIAFVSGSVQGRNMYLFTAVE